MFRSGCMLATYEETRNNNSNKTMVKINIRTKIILQTYCAERIQLISTHNRLSCLSLEQLLTTIAVF